MMVWTVACARAITTQVYSRLRLQLHIFFFIPLALREHMMKKKEEKKEVGGYQSALKIQLAQPQKPMGKRHERTLFAKKASHHTSCCLPHVHRQRRPQSSSWKTCENDEATTRSAAFRAITDRDVPKALPGRHAVENDETTTHPAAFRIFTARDVRPPLPGESCG
ncbi:hypothetical protein VN97_g1235 [Penicillium thymicola]|uniref:Uncharacterized protein n=1 Tax=Penicillium thymicola TaxID=293382 RepID=A0AAI9TS51_PENTH|nr:hypothetical protein VN97_g1235 [Penicillium thymicola]